MAEKLKKNDPDEFKMIVRRLFFETLDIPFDETLFKTPPDTPVDACKGCFPGIGREKANNEDLIPERYHLAIIRLIRFLSKEKNIVQEGIFRKGGSVKKQQELKTRLVETDSEDIELLENGSYSVHECASVLKSLLGYLPQPLAMDHCIKAHMKIAQMMEVENASDKMIVATQLIIQLMSDTYLDILKELMKLLQSVSLRQNENKMSSLNLGTVFSTHVVCPKNMPPVEIQSHLETFTKVTTHFIDHHKVIFDTPAILDKEIQSLNFSRGTEARRSLALQSKKRPGVICLVANTVLGFGENDESDGIERHENTKSESNDTRDNLTMTL